jgi:hypothetical protein
MLSFIITPNATYKINTILVNGVEIDVTVNQGDAQTYTFNSVESYCLITATFVLKEFTINFVDYDNSVIDSQILDYGTDALAPANPTRENYRFTGWDTDFTNITANLTVKAQYIEQFTVTFEDYNGAVLSEQIIDLGSGAVSPTNPTRDNYRFTGWDIDFTNVTANITVTAQYIEQFVITVIQSQNGIISPETISIDLNTNQSFTITPNYIYIISSIIMMVFLKRLVIMEKFIHILLKM